MKRILIGALAATAAVAAIPSAASAATCTYDSTAKTMDVRYRANETSVTIKPGSSLQFSDAGVLRACSDPATGKAATGSNTVKLTVSGPSGQGPSTQTTILDETTTALGELNPRLDMFVRTGTDDKLVVRKGARKDTVRLTDGLGPELDLDYDLDADVHMTTVNSVVQVEGGAGNDLLDASQVRHYETILQGQGNDDVLSGGAQADILDGGPGFDTAEIRLNTGDASISIEKPLFF